MALPLYLAVLLPCLALAAPQQDAYLGVIFDASDRPTVAEVVPGSPAEKAGIQPGDVLLAIDGTAMPNVDAFAEAIRKHSPNDKIKLSIRRNGQLIELAVTLGKRFDEGEKAEPKKEPKKDTPKPVIPQEKQDKQDKAPKPVTPAAPGGGRPFLGVSVEETQDGLIVRSVLDASPAQRAGVVVADRIESIGGTQVSTLDGLDAALTKIGAGAKTMLGLKRANKPIELALTVGSLQSSPRPDAPKPATDRPPVSDRQPAPANVQKPVAVRPDAPPRTVPSVAKPAESPVSSPRISSPKLLEVLAAAKQKQSKALVLCGAAWSASSQAQKRSLGHESLHAVLERVPQVWIDVDGDGQLADQLGVRELPTLVLLDPEGRIVAKKDGYLPPDMLLAWLEQHAKSAPPPAQPQAQPNTQVQVQPRPEARVAARAPVAKATDAEDLQALRAEIARLRADLEALRAEVAKLKR